MADPPGTIRRVDPQAEADRLAGERSRRRIVLAESILGTRKAPEGDDEVLWLSVWTEGHEAWVLPTDLMTRIAAAAREILQEAVRG